MTEDKKNKDHQIQMSGLDDLFKEAEASVDKYAPEQEAAEAIPSGSEGAEASEQGDPADWDIEKMDLEAIEVVNGPEPDLGQNNEEEADQSPGETDLMMQAHPEPSDDSPVEQREEPTKNERPPQVKEPEENKGPSPEEVVMQAMIKEKNRMTLAISRLEHEKKDHKKEKEQYKESLVRVSANFDNYKKRVARDKDEVFKAAQDEVLKVLFDVADNLERATQINMAEADEADGDLAQKVLEGVNMTLRSVQASLNKLDVTAFSAVDSFFDPNFHEAVQRVENDSVPEGWVVEEYYKGYLQGERLIRAALVVVAFGGISRKEWEAANLPDEPEPTPEDTDEGDALGDTSESKTGSGTSTSSSASGETSDSTEAVEEESDEAGEEPSVGGEQEEGEASSEDSAEGAFEQPTQPEEEPEVESESPKDGD